jgi:hypothetical protein
LRDVVDFQSIIGKGIIGTVDGKRVADGAIAEGNGRKWRNRVFFAPRRG